MQIKKLQPVLMFMYADFHDNDNSSSKAIENNHNNKNKNRQAQYTLNATFLSHI